MADDQRASAPASTAAPPSARATRSEARELLSFVLKLALFVLVLRTLVFAPFSIPSESMLPRLLIGDYLFITKWNYGYSRYSLPFGLPLFPGRVFGRLPERGDVVVFKAPPTASVDYIKRVVGLPGDSVQVRNGQVILNGVAVARQRIADFTVPSSPNFDCPAEVRGATGLCRFPQYRETLPGGRSYRVLDQGPGPADDTRVFTVPAGHLFLMGDNRDDSMDSRFPAVEGGGIGLVPIENIEGKAAVSFFSTDGSASWLKPWSWVAAARWDRIGEGF